MEIGGGTGAGGGTTGIGVGIGAGLMPAGGWPVLMRPISADMVRSSLVYGFSAGLGVTGRLGGMTTLGLKGAAGAGRGGGGGGGASGRIVGEFG